MTLKSPVSIIQLLWVALLLPLIIPQTGLAQKAPLSVADSLRLETFIDSIRHTAVYSVGHQRFLDSALSVVPQNAYLWQQKAMPLFKMQKYELGLPYLDSAVKYNPRKYTDYRAFMKCIFQKSYRDAINDFEAARLLNGNAGVMDHPYDFYVGLCYLQLNMFDSCVFYMNKCIEYKTKTTGAAWVHPLDWFYEGIAWYEKEDDMKAVRCFDSSLSLYKNFADAQFYKAVCLYRMGKTQEAIAVMAEGKTNIQEGRTFNEDNAIYEKYPYQVNPLYFDNYLRYWQEKENGMGK